MASQRNRPGRTGPRGGTNDFSEEKDLWEQIRAQLQEVKNNEQVAGDNVKKIFATEDAIKEREQSGTSMSSHLWPHFMVPQLTDILQKCLQMISINCPAPIAMEFATLKPKRLQLST